MSNSSNKNAKKILPLQLPLIILNPKISSLVIAPNKV